MLQKSDYIHGEPPEWRTVPSLGEYLLAEGGRWQHVSSGLVFYPAEETSWPLSPAQIKGPATVHDERGGYQRVYTYISWEKAKRTLVLVRLPYDPLDNPYEDHAIDSLITSVPRSKGERTYTYECGSCGKCATLRRVRNKVECERILRAHGWSDTIARGWVCPRHRYRKQRTYAEKH